MEDCDKYAKIGRAVTCEKKFGGWKNFLIAAGFDPSASRIFIFAFEQNSDMGINNEQPISIGEIIYRNQKIEYISNGKVVNAIVYTAVFLPN